MIDFTRMWREFKADIIADVTERMRRAGIVGTTIDGHHIPAASLPTHSHAHADTTGQTANDHHNQAHALFGSDHSDVETSTAPEDGQALVWDAVTSRWVPGAVGSSTHWEVLLDDTGDPIIADGDWIYCEVAA